MILIPRQTFVPTVLLKILPLASGFQRAWNSMLPLSLWGLTPWCIQTFVPTVLLKMLPLASGFRRAWNSMLPFSLWRLTPQGLQTFVPTLLLKRPFLGLCNTTLNPCSQKLLFLLPSILKLSWALEGNFRAWQLKGQIARFGPSARNS